MPNPALDPTTDRFIPEVVEPARYFLQEIDNPTWHWAIRGVFLAGLLFMLIVYWCHHRKMDTPSR